MLFCVRHKVSAERLLTRQIGFDYLYRTAIYQQIVGYFVCQSKQVHLIHAQAEQIIVEAFWVIFIVWCWLLCAFEDRLKAGCELGDWNLTCAGRSPAQSGHLG